MDQTIQSLQDKIRAAAADRGIDPDTALRIANAESTLSNAAKNTRSSARGLFQIIDSTWKNFGGDPAKRNDVDENIRVGLNVIAGNRDSFLKRFGKEPTKDQLYSMHVLGTGDAFKVFNAADDAAIKNIVPKKVIKSNPYMEKMSVADFLNFTQAKMAKKGTAAPTTVVAKTETAPVPMPQTPKETMRQAPSKMPSSRTVDLPTAANPTAPPMNKDLLASLGPNYQAALAAMTLSDSSEDDDDEALAERYAERFADQGNEVVPSTLGDIQLSYASPFEDTPVQMATGGEVGVQKMAFGGLPYKPSALIPSRVKNQVSSAQSALDAYNNEVNSYNDRLNQYNTQAEDYRRQVEDYNNQINAYNDQLNQYKSSYIGGDNPVVFIKGKGGTYQAAIGKAGSLAQNTPNINVSEYGRIPQLGNVLGYYIRQGDYRGASEPTAPGSFSATAPTAPNAPTQPTQTIESANAAVAAAKEKQRRLQLTYDVMEDPERFNLSMPALFAEGGEAEKSTSAKLFEAYQKYTADSPLLNWEAFYKSVTPLQLRTFLETTAMPEETRKDRPITEKNLSDSELRQLLDTIGGARKNRAKEKGLNSTYTPTSKDIKLDQLFEKMMGKDPAFQKAKARTEAEKKHFESGSGSVNYMDYPGFLSDVRDSTLSKEGAIRNTLGRFVYEALPDGRIRVKDRYDFKNDLEELGQRPSAAYKGMSDVEKMGTIVVDTLNNPMDLQSEAGGMKVGRATLPSRMGSAFIGEKGRPVDITLDPRELMPGYAGYAHGGPVHRADGSPIYGEMADTGPITADTRAAMSNFQVPNAREAMDALKKIYGEGVSNAESLVRGSLAAVPGTFGDIGQSFDIRGLRNLPTTEQLLKKYPQRMTQPTAETAKFEDVGTYMPPPIPPAVVSGTAKSMMKGLKESGPQVESVMRKIAPAAEPFNIVRPAGGEFSTVKSASETPISTFDQNLAQLYTSRPDPDYAAVNKFFDTKIRDYFKKQAGSVSDPVREALISGKIKIPKGSDLEEVYPEALIKAARDGDVTSMKLLEKQLDEGLNLRTYKLINSRVGSGVSMNDFAIASDETRLAILQQMKSNPNIIPDAMLLRLAKKNASNLSPDEAAKKVADIRAKLKANPELFSTVFEEKIMKMIPKDKDMTHAVTPEFMEKFPSLYGKLKGIAGTRKGIMSLEGAAPIIDTATASKGPMLFGMPFEKIHTLMQSIPPKELEQMDVPTMLNRVIQLDNVASEAASYTTQAEKLISAGKAVPEKISTFGTKPFTTKDRQGFMWREITEPDATTIQAKLLGNSIGGYALPGTYGKLAKGRIGLTNGEVRLFGLYDNNNQLVTNVEYLTKKADVSRLDPSKGIKPNTITQFFGNGPNTGNVAPENYLSQVIELVNKLSPDEVPPTIQNLFYKNSIFFDDATGQVTNR